MSQDTTATPLFWVQVQGKAFPFPVIEANDFNIYVQVPGQDCLAILPISSQDKTWKRIRGGQ